MGNHLSKLQCCGTGSGSTHGSGPSPVQQSVAGGSAVTGSRSDNAFSVKEIADLQKLLEYVQEVIGTYKNDSASKVIPQGLVSGSLNEADDVLSQISKAIEKKKWIKDVLAEARSELPNVLKGLGNLHWVAAGISMVASVLDRMDQMHENKENCLSVLEDLGNLSQRLVELLQVGLPNANDTLREAAFLICAAVIWCDQRLQTGRLKRFAYVNITNEYIENLRSQITGLYRQLSLALGTQTYKTVKSMQRQMSTSLRPYKPPYPRDTVGLEGKVIEVLKRLGVTGETMEPGSWAILLHGMGGIGKTTLATAVCAKIPITEDFVAGVEVGDNATPKVILKIQRDICERLFQDRRRIGSCGEGRERLRMHLSRCRHPVLLFIDNVFKQEDLRTLLPVPLDLPDGSRLIITARDKRICEVFNACKSYLVRELEKPDCEKLFDQLVEGCPPGTEQQVANVLEICGGLPLALEVVGGYLGPPGNRKAKLREWDSVIDGLRNCQNINGEAREKLNDILAWSYEQLGEGTKQVFLDVSYLLRNADWDWGECLGTGSELERLKDLSLVKRVDGESSMFETIFRAISNSGAMQQDQEKLEEMEVDQFLRIDLFLQKLQKMKIDQLRIDSFFQHRSTIEVHDLLVGLGTHISKSSPRTRFSFNSPETFGDLLTDDRQDHGVIEGLVVELVDCKHDLPAAKLDAMHASLRILVLRGRVHIQGTCDRLPHQLQVCCVHLDAGGIAFPYKDISGFNKLRVLDIHGGVACDFRDMQFPRSLEILKLQNVDELHAFHSNSFEKCIFLRTLHIKKCSKFQQLPYSFCGLEKLSTLVLGNNPGLKVLPDFDRLQSLQILAIVHSALEVPCGIDKLVKLQKLWIEGVERLPNDLDQILFGLTLLEILLLDLAGSNKELPKGFQNAFYLDTKRGDSVALEELPSDFGGLMNLHHLNLWGCDQLETLPNSMVSLQSLRRLVMCNCTRLQNLPNNFGNFIALERLVLNDCVQLKELPHDFGNLIALQELVLDGAKRLKVLPDRFFSLKNLRFLSLIECINLESLPWPASLASLQNLKLLSLGGCTKLKELPTDFSDLVALQVLDLHHCESLESLPDNMASLKHLTEVILSGCTRLKKLPKDFDSLQARAAIDIDGCTQLESPSST